MSIISTPPEALQKFYSKLHWKVETNEPNIYLTFDDGPTPGITEKVLDLLKTYNAKATFFCIGNNVAKNRTLFDRIIAEGHQVGNHTNSHLNGWKTKTADYIENVMQCTEIFQSNLFRPPYGRIKKKQIKKLQEQFKIVMWSVLSMDFDSNKTEDQCWEITAKQLKPGAIVTFHDSLKAEKRMLATLQKTLKLGKEKAWRFKVID
ncbi:MAG: polysaccharide deacetylase family protein [Vicingaceae bacterium]